MNENVARFVASIFAIGTIFTYIIICVEILESSFWIKILKLWGGIVVAILSFAFWGWFWGLFIRRAI